MCRAITYNQDRIWASQERNIDFREVLAANKRFLVKLKLTHLYFEAKFDIFKINKNLCTGLLYRTDLTYGLSDQEM
jgi:hypothetical protein